MSAPRGLVVQALFGPRARIHDEAGFVNAANAALDSFGGPLAAQAKELLFGKRARGRIDGMLVDVLKGTVGRSDAVKSILRFIDPATEFVVPMSEKEATLAFGIMPGMGQFFARHRERFGIVAARGRTGTVWQPAQLAEVFPGFERELRAALEKQGVGVDW